jgi:MoaA/NifB/PqqE/SkfB family radical SAM enzyme
VIPYALAGAAIKSGLGAARYRLTGHRAPLNLGFVVTRRCNALCGYCKDPLAASDELTTEEALGVIDAACTLGAARVGFTGGEPLLREDLGALVDRAVEHGAWVTVETNGYLYAERASTLGKVGRFIVSIDGRPANHDRARERGAFERALAAARAMRRDGHRVGLAAALAQDNLGDVEFLLGLAEELGAEVRWQPLIADPARASRRAARMAASKDELRVALRQILDARRSGRPVAMSERVLLHLLAWPDPAQFRAPAPIDDVLCTAGQLWCTVDADGTVVTCLPRAGSVAGGNTRREGFAAAFDRLRDRDCHACASAACTEYNLLYDLDPSAWTDTLLGAASPRVGRAVGAAP